MKPTEQILFLTKDADIIYVPFIGAIKSVLVFEYVSVNN